MKNLQNKFFNIGVISLTAFSHFIGWVCAASGTPGTWKQFGKIED